MAITISVLLSTFSFLKIIIFVQLNTLQLLITFDFSNAIIPASKDIPIYLESLTEDLPYLKAD